MGTAKRDRQRANRQQRLEELARDARKGTTKRWGLRLGLGLPVVLGLIFLLAYVSRDKKNSATTSDSAPTTVPVTLPDTTLAPDGSATTLDPTTTTVDANATTTTLAPFEYGKGGCPAADGTSVRQASFAQPFKLCIDPTKMYTATFDTSEGEIVVELNTADVPGTVNNFVTLSRFHYYDDSQIFRGDKSIDIIQGGGKSNEDTPGYSLPDEKNGFSYSEGDFVMARTDQPDSGGGQWFFAGGPNVSNLDAQGTYVTFGKVTSGLDVVKKILDFATDDGKSMSTPVAVKTVTVTAS